VEGICLPGTGTCESRSHEDAKIPTRQKWNSTGKRKEKKGIEKRNSVDLWIPACFLVAMCTMQVSSLYLPDPVGYLISIVCVLLGCPWTWTLKKDFGRVPFSTTITDYYYLLLLYMIVTSVSIVNL
jgi:hypothetical protein